MNLHFITRRTLSKAVFAAAIAAMMMPSVLAAPQTVPVKPAAVVQQYADLAPAQEVVLNDITVYAFDESPLTLESSIFPDLSQYPDRMALMPKGQFHTITRTYLIQTGDRRVLVDGGWGTESGVDGRTVDYLMKYGVSADDVTDILLTHMDVDHISGLLHGSKAVYPDAVLHIAAKEYDRWIVQGADREAEYIALARKVAKAYEGRIALFDYDEEILPGITARNANGHTMGHTCYDVTSGNKGLTIVGDMIHVAPIQMRHTEYCSVYDVDPALAAQTRERVLSELSRTDRLIAGMHFPQIGKVRKDKDGGYVVVPETKP